MKNTIKIGTKLLSLDKPLIMGILNLTPDSFYKDSRFNHIDEAFLKKANEMVDEGLDIFDIGGFSTRPGGLAVSADEEIGRLLPAIEILKRNFPQIPISIDTFRASVAEQLLEAGADIINDISGGDFDEEMFPLIIKKNVPYILMHLKGDFQNMHTQIHYNDYLPEVLDKLFKKANYLRSKGVTDVILDPGFGFSKTIEQNYQLLNELDLLHNEHFPILAGLSRKSMIYKLLQSTPDQILPYSMLVHAIAIQNKSSIIRVHDIKIYKDFLKIKEIMEVSNKTKKPLKF